MSLQPVRSAPLRSNSLHSASFHFILLHSPSLQHEWDVTIENLATRKWRNASPLIAFALLLLSPSVLAEVTGPAQCSPSNGGGSAEPPSGKVFITIESMRLAHSMDPNWPFVENRTDVYGKVFINADGVEEVFNLAEVSGSDFPHWTRDNRFVSRAAAAGTPVSFRIHLMDSDSGSSDDAVDTSPDAARNDLEFVLDTCSMQITGDITGRASDLAAVDSGTGSNQGELRISVGMDDGRPLSTVESDVALVGFDLIQVLPNRDLLISGKNTVAMVSVTNNTPVKQPVSVHLIVRDAASQVVLHESTESMGDLAIGEVRTFYMGEKEPLIFDGIECGTSDIEATATLILDPNSGLDIPESRACSQVNNSSGVNTWTIVHTETPEVLWIRTGRLLDAGNLASMDRLHEMRDLAMPFYRDSYPISDIDDGVSSFPMIPPATGLTDFLTALLTGIGVPADGAVPYVLVAELNAVAAATGADRVMGVLPKAWFKTFLYGILDNTSGISLGEWMPRAVIFESSSKDDNNNGSGPALALPAHELGHTYGLSVDPDLKTWLCNIDGGLGVILCGITGGYDEYQSDNHPDGAPTWGYWSAQGDVPLGLDGLTGEQCDSTCMMGPNVINAHENWNGGKNWIGSADYDHLVDKLRTKCRSKPVAPAGSTAYVSGAIAQDETAFLGHTFNRRSDTTPADFASRPGDVLTPYKLVFFDSRGRELGTSELPVNWVHADTDLQVPVSFFGGYVEFPERSRRLRVLSRLSGNVVMEREITRNRPRLSTPSATVRTNRDGEQTVEIEWRAADRDGDTLSHSIQVSPDGTKWWPVTSGLGASSFTMEVPPEMHSGTYFLRVLSTDGFNMESSDGQFIVR